MTEAELSHFREQSPVGTKLRLDYAHQGTCDAESGQGIEGWVAHHGPVHLEISDLPHSSIPGDLITRLRAEFDGVLHAYDYEGITDWQVLAQSKKTNGLIPK